MVAIAAGDDLPSAATVILCVSKGQQPDDGSGVDLASFNIHDDGISVTWVEHFDGAEGEQLLAAARALNNGYKIRKSAAIARARVESILLALAAVGRTARVQYDPITDPAKGNLGHCVITGIAVDDVSGLFQLAQAFRDQITPAPEIKGLFP